MYNQYFSNRNVFYQVLKGTVCFGMKPLKLKYAYIYYICLYRYWESIPCAGSLLSMSKIRRILSAFQSCTQEQIIAFGNIVVYYCMHH